MSCMVKQSPSQNKPCCIDGDESFESLRREAWSYTQRAGLHIQSDYLSVAHPYIRTYTFTHTHWTCSFCSRTDSHLTPAAKTHDCEQHLVKKGWILMHTHTRLLWWLTFPAVNVTMGRKMMPSLASGTFAHTAAKTAMTAPDYGFKGRHVKDEGLLYLFLFSHLTSLQYLPLLTMGKVDRLLFCTCSLP